MFKMANVKNRDVNLMIHRLELVRIKYTRN